MKQAYPSKKFIGILSALKFGKIDLKKMPTALELLPTALGRFGLLYKLIESSGGSGSKLKTGVITFVSGDTPLISESIIWRAILSGICP